MMRTWNSALETIGLPPPTGEALKRHLEKLRTEKHPFGPWAFEETNKKVGRCWFHLAETIFHAYSLTRTGCAGRLKRRICCVIWLREMFPQRNAIRTIMYGISPVGSRRVCETDHVRAIAPSNLAPDTNISLATLFDRNLPQSN
jgi:hypothetical protein